MQLFAGAAGRLRALNCSRLFPGIGDQQVTMSADGAQIAALACSLKLPSAQAQGCPLRADVYRWTQ